MWKPIYYFAEGNTALYLVGNPTGLAENYGVTPNTAIDDDFFENKSMTVALVEDTIHQYRNKHHATVVWATHNLFQARRVADRTALFLNGQLVEAAATEDFFTNPSDPRTASFVQGRMVY